MEDGEVLVLTLRGELSDGTLIVGEDVVVILEREGNELRRVKNENSVHSINDPEL